ncbi:thiamine-phosphate pyrophosphorylase [Pedobacter sp. UYP30]|uniref:thiamine phosphate synthase n=1 Tax=Pedobacter sp. UYP30 TaxID=1756400 RepID=UPI00339536F1
MISKLHYISQKPVNGTHLKSIDNALNSGCKWIQLRMKDQPLELVLDTALAARELCNQHQAKLIINDYPQVALASKADGLHLGLLDMSVADAREIVGHKMIIGGTANTLEHILQRVAEGVDYIGLGPFRFTKTKKNLSPILGLQGYQNLIAEMRKKEINIPVIAIGGIELADVSSVMETGVHGVAVSGAITFAQNREEVIAEIYQKVETKYIAFNN